MLDMIIIIHSRPCLSKKCSKVAPTSRMDSSSRQGQMMASHSPTLSYLSSGTEVGFTNVVRYRYDFNQEWGSFPNSIPKRYNWTGLLVEPNPEAFQSMKETHRKAWLLPQCFSTKTTPEVVEFDTSGLFGEIVYYIWHQLCETRVFCSYLPPSLWPFLCHFDIRC